MKQLYGWRLLCCCSSHDGGVLLGLQQYIRAHCPVILGRVLLSAAGMLSWLCRAPEATERGSRIPAPNALHVYVTLSILLFLTSSSQLTAYSSTGRTKSII